MTEQTAANAGNTNQAQQQFAVQRVFLKDLSFESPQGAEIFRSQWQPKINQDLNTKLNKLEDDVYEIVLTVTITAKSGEQNAFLVEVQQAGIFVLKGLNQQQLAHVANTTCPTILFPYAREVVDNVITKGSFPPLHLPPVNFEALFAQAVQRAQKQGGNR